MFVQRCRPGSRGYSDITAMATIGVTVREPTLAGESLGYSKCRTDGASDGQLARGHPERFENKRRKTSHGATRRCALTWDDANPTTDSRASQLRRLT